MSTSDVEDQLLSYVARRQNGSSTLARAVVARTVDRYTAAVWVLEKYGSTSNRFWDALEALSEALDGLMHGFAGEPDYFFGPRQFDELVLPALRGTLPGGGGGRPLGQMTSVAGEMLLHVDCESLSLDQQRDALTELTRILAAFTDGGPLALEMRFCMVKLIAKLLFERTCRGFEDDMDRQIHMPLAAQAARQGVLREALCLLEGAPESSPSLPPGLSSLGFDPIEEDVDDVNTLFAAHRMVAGLLLTEDCAGAAQWGSWAANRPQLMKSLLHKLSRPPTEHNLLLIFHTLRLVGQLANVSPDIVVAMQAGGVKRLLAKLKSAVAVPDEMGATEVGMWAERLCCDPAQVGTLHVCCWDHQGGGGLTLTLPQKRLPPPPQAGQRDTAEPSTAGAPEPPPTEEEALRVAAAAAGGVLGAGWRLSTREELAALPVRELKSRLERADIDASGCTEKAELVELLLGRCMQPTSPPQTKHPQAAQPAQQRQARQPAQGVVEGAPAPKRCACCGATAGPATKLKVCSGCRSVHFCGKACQRQAWPSHKAACRASQQQHL